MTNISKVKTLISEHDYDAILITDPISRFFLTGFASSAGALLISESNSWFFTDSRYFEAAKNELAGASVNLADSNNPYSAQINTVIKDLHISNLGFEDEKMTYSAYLDWKNKLTAQLTPIKKLINDLRMIKSGDDLERIKKAHRIAEKSFLEILPQISTQITEKQLSAELICRFLKNGADDKAFDPIVVSGVKSSLPHGLPGDVKIGPGFLVIDFGVKLDGWCSDTTRTISVGKPDEYMIRIYDTVLNAQKAGISTIRAGVLGRDVDAAGRSVIDEAGFGEYFGHSFGHGIGLEVHEAPSASLMYDGIIPQGAVITAEPGIYLPGQFGVRIEDVVYVKENGCENITAVTNELIII